MAFKYIGRRNVLAEGLPITAEIPSETMLVTPNGD